MDTTGELRADPLLGMVLDHRYLLVEQVARGGMATVYRALDERLDRPVAVKVMHRAFADDPDFVARFTREARSAARLSAPEVVSVFDQGHDRETGLVYLVMELVRGRDLRDLMSERGALSPARALSLLEPVLTALAAAHAAGIVHRDVKPENVLLGDDGRVKVADFGLARAVEASSVTATTGLLIGTVAYLAPEQIERGTADVRTDVYAAGVLLWEVLVGRAPHLGDSPVQVLFQHVNTDVPPPSTFVAGIPAGLDDLVVRATRRDPARRPADAGAFLAEVRALRQDLPAVGRRHDTAVQGQLRPAPRPASRRVPDTAPQPDPPQRRRRGRRGLVAGLLVLALAGLAGTGGWWFVTGRYTSAPGVLSLAGADAETQLRQAGFSVVVEPEPVFSEDVPTGAVVDQSPDPSDRVLKNGQITLVVSKGQDRRTVPTVVGLTEDTATTALTAQGLRVAETLVREFSPEPVGTVLSSRPGVGELLRPDTAVTLVLSKGIEQLPVPDVVGRTRGAAVAAVTTAGFADRVEEAFDEQVPAGSVLAQAPAGGQAGRGSTVTLTVSRGPEPRTIPADLVGQRKGPAQARLEALGLEVRVIEIPGPGVVRSASPGPGRQVERGSTVTLYVF